MTTYLKALTQKVISYIRQVTYCPRRWRCVCPRMTVRIHPYRLQAGLTCAPSISPGVVTYVQNLIGIQS